MRTHTPSQNAVRHVGSWTIAIFCSILAGIGMACSLIGETPPPAVMKNNDHPLDNVSGTFKEITRHFQENDKGPVLQWIERTRLVNKMESHCVVLVKEKGSNADVIIPEMADFLRSSGYEVSTDSAKVKLPKEQLGLTFDVKKNCVMVHIGIL